MEGEAHKELEQEVLEQVSRQELWEHTRFIAEEERLSGSEGESRAVRYFEEVMSKWGLSVEIIHHDALISLPVKGELFALSPEKKTLSCITHSFSLSTGPDGVKGILCTADSAAGEGSIIVMDGLASPANVDKGRAAGASGMIFVNTGERPREFIITPVWGHPSTESASQIPDIPIVTVNRENGEYLKGMMRKGAMEVRMVTDTWTGWKELPLAVAQLDGEEEPEKFIMVSGHIDSWYYGATDNATANACILELARILAGRRSSLKRSVRFIWWSGHSHGRYAGSTWYADNYWEDLHRNCVAHINVDSLGSKGAVDYSEIMVSSEMMELGESVVRDVTGQETRGARMHRAGDQSFWGAGVPAMYMLLSRVPVVGSGADLLAPGVGWWWHTADDTLDKVDPEILKTDTQAYMSTVWRLAAGRVLPITVKPVALEILSVLDDLQEEADGAFDLTSTLAAAQKLLKTASLFDETGKQIAKGDTTGEDVKQKASMVNNALMKCSRFLMPVLYTLADKFDHDPAVPIPPIPGLQPIKQLARLAKGSADFRYLHTGLVRQRNRVEHALNSAKEYLDISLRHL